MKIFIRNPQKKRLTENKDKQLLNEFTSADKQAVLEDGDRFTVSYEIELESSEGGGGGFNSTSYQDARERLAAGYLESYYFDETVRENEASSLWYDLDVDESDVDELMTWFINESETGSDEQNYKNYLLIEAAISRNPEQMKELVSFITDVVDPKTELNRKFHKFMEEHCADLGSVQLEMFETMAKTLFRKHILNIDKAGDLIYPEVPCNIEALFGIMGEEDLFTELIDAGEAEWDNVAFPAGWTSVHDLTSIGSDTYRGSPILEELAELIEKAAENYIEEKSQAEYDEYQDDPVDYLDNMGFEWDESLDEDDYYNDSDYETLLWEHLPKFMRKWRHALKFEPDGSLDNGIEFSMDTPPFMTGLSEAFEFLEDFYEDYNNQDNFEMNSNTGLHTNVGMLDAEGERKEGYNLVKALLYINQEFATKGMGMSSRQHNRWVGDIRKKAKDLMAGTISKKDQRGKIEFPGLNSAELMNFLESDLSSAVLDAARQNPKGVGFNVGYINTRGYVEFRYPGGESATLENMKNATLYYAHIVKAALEPQYKRRDYVKKLIGFVNQIASEESKKITSLTELRSLRPGAVLAKSYYSGGYDLLQYYRYLVPKETRDEMNISHSSFRGSQHYFFEGMNASEKVVKLSTIDLDTSDVLAFTMPFKEFERLLQDRTYRVLAYGKKGVRKDERVVKAIHDFLAVHTLDKAEKDAYAERESEIQYSQGWTDVRNARRKAARYKQTFESPFPSEEPTQEEWKLSKSAFPEAEVSGIQQQLRDKFKPFLDAANYRRPGQKKKEAQ